ncbi:MAG: zf-HC2 domain-containing protein [Betaproteobacteria bacterium]|nr:zf-HC2 domain-containing protein [Betaproteobacteria bacterium]
MLRLSCNQASRLLSDRQDRELARGERFALGMHLFICKACTNFDRQIGFLRRALHSWPGPDDESSKR